MYCYTVALLSLAVCLYIIYRGISAPSQRLSFPQLSATGPRGPSDFVTFMVLRTSAVFLGICVRWKGESVCACSGNTSFSFTTEAYFKRDGASLQQTREPRNMCVLMEKQTRVHLDIWVLSSVSAAP